MLVTYERARIRELAPLVGLEEYASRLRDVDRALRSAVDGDAAERFLRMRSELEHEGR